MLYRQADTTVLCVISVYRQGLTVRTVPWCAVITFRLSDAKAWSVCTTGYHANFRVQSSFPYPHGFDDGPKLFRNRAALSEGRGVQAGGVYL